MIPLIPLHVVACMGIVHGIVVKHLDPSHLGLTHTVAAFTLALRLLPYVLLRHTGRPCPGLHPTIHGSISTCAPAAVSRKSILTSSMIRYHIMMLHMHGGGVVERGLSVWVPSLSPDPRRCALLDVRFQFEPIAGLSLYTRN